MNVFTVTGRLGRDAQTYEAKNGEKFYTFSLADSKKIRGEEKTTWYDIMVFSNRQIDGMIPYLKKGSAVVVTGELEAEIRTGNDNVQRLSLTVRADRVTFNNSGSNNNTTNVTATQSPAKELKDEIVVTSSSSASPITNNDDLPF